MIVADLLIRGGTVVDGTGATAYESDVRISDGRITEIGKGLRPDGENLLDASGAYVSPGFIDLHTHFDPGLFDLGRIALVFRQTYQFHDKRMK